MPCANAPACTSATPTTDRASTTWCSRFPTTPSTRRWPAIATASRSEEHTSELQSLMRISYAVFCLKKKKNNNNNHLFANDILFNKHIHHLFYILSDYTLS